MSRKTKGKGDEKGGVHPAWFVGAGVICLAGAAAAASRKASQNSPLDAMEEALAWARGEYVPGLEVRTLRALPRNVGGTSTHRSMGSMVRAGDAAEVTITSDPPGSTVWINGESYGTTPLTATLSVDDTYVLEAVADRPGRYGPYEDLFVFAPGPSELHIDHVVLFEVPAPPKADEPAPSKAKRPVEVIIPPAFRRQMKKIISEGELDDFIEDIRRDPVSCCQQEGQGGQVYKARGTYRVGKRGLKGGRSGGPRYWYVYYGGEAPMVMVHVVRSTDKHSLDDPTLAGLRAAAKHFKALFTEQGKMYG